MSQQNNQQIVARQVERIVRRLTSLSTLPSVAASLLNLLNEEGFDKSRLAESIQADPALTAQVLLLAKREGVQFINGPSVSEALHKLPLPLVREAVISVKVFNLSEPNEQADENRTLPRKQMAIHSLAVACCGDELAQLVLPQEQRQTAWVAGLLHDIGKFALDEVMPKSFEKMVAQARDENAALSEIERTHLGIDHSVLGRRLAQKWNLPEAVTAAIWLHHCDAQTLGADLPHVQLVRVVALADRLVRLWQIGQSGSFNSPDTPDEFSKLLSISSKQLDAIELSVKDKVSEKSRILGLAGGDGTAEYYSVIHKTAADLAKDNLNLSRAGQYSEQAELTEEFLNVIDENASPIEIAQSFAKAWQKHAKSGLTCVYVVTDATEPWVELALVDRQGRPDIKSHRMPEHTSSIPEILNKGNTEIQFSDGAKWLIEQTGAEFRPELMMMAPLRIGDKVVGVLAYENLGQNPAGRFLQSLKIAASAIAMAMAVQKQYELSERFVEMMNSLRRTRTELSKAQSFEGLAEMAAGAAHELNNPLAVISGRAQLLLTGEEDETKKQMLGQIQSRTAEISEIITELMNFARPKEPDKKSVTVGELLTRSAELTKKANGLSSLEAELSGSSLIEAVYVDINQVSQCLSHIMNNALQSYKGQNGPIWIECKSEGENIAITIRDKGCGMDTQTLAKATEPFYSYRPAGRRRGMGLANAQRMLKLNGGSLKLDSVLDEGTTVTVTLPKA